MNTRHVDITEEIWIGKYTDSMERLLEDIVSLHSCKELLSIKFLYR